MHAIDAPEHPGKPTALPFCQETGGVSFIGSPEIFFSEHLHNSLHIFS
jgi:hypothetical protein